MFSSIFISIIFNFIAFNENELFINSAIVIIIYVLCGFSDNRKSSALLVCIRCIWYLSISLNRTEILDRLNVYVFTFS